MIRLIVQSCMALLLTAFVSACKKEDPNPELLDPIFKDLEARAAAYTRNAEESKAKIPALESDLAKAEPRSIDLKNIQRISLRKN